MAYYDKFINNQLENSKGITYEIKPGSVLEGVTPESDTLNERADDIAHAVTQEVLFYKNVLMPEVKAVFKNVNTSIESSKRKMLANGSIDLVLLDIPKAITMEEISYNENLDYMDYSNVVLDSKSAEAIRELIGSENTFLDSVSDARLNNAWELYIKEPNNENTNITAACNMNVVTSKNVEDVFIIYYILKGIIAKDYAEGRGDLLPYRENIARYFNYVKKSIVMRIAKIKAGISNNIIVLSTNDRPGSLAVRIIATQFIDYKESGGDVDALYGLAVSKEIYAGSKLISVIIENQISLAKDYKKAHAILLNKTNTELASITHKALMSNITFMISRLPKEDAETNYDRVKDYINHLEFSALKSCITIIEDIYTEVLYTNLNFKTFLGHVKYYSDSTSIKHAMTLAISDMVATFLVNAVDVQKG